MSNLDLSAYAGRWVALWQERVVGYGNTPDDALTLARRNQPKDRFALRFVESAKGTPLPIPPLLEQLRPFFLTHPQPIYLVGGAVRDLLLKRPFHDLDFVLPTDGIKTAFAVGDAFDWPAYTLDQERDTGRVVLPDGKTTLDFARFRGASLEADLRDRDFTLNAMALPATAALAESVIDPLNGRSALTKQTIALTHPNAIQDDPVRALRAIRQSIQFGFTLTPETEAALQLANLNTISIERVRDEFLKLLETAVPHTAIAQLRRFGLLNAIIPELTAAFANAPIHAQTLAMLEQATTFRTVPQVTDLLASFGEPLQARWQYKMDGNIPQETAFRLAVLLHQLDQPAAAIEQRLRQLTLSNEVVEYVKKIVVHHKRIEQLSLNAHLSRRDLFRYFRDTHGVGIDVAFLDLLNVLAAAETVLLDAHFDRLRQLLYAFFEQHGAIVDPVLLLNGRNLMQTFHLEPGPEIGRLLRLLKEEQAAGQVKTTQEAHQFIQKILN